MKVLTKELGNVQEILKYPGHHVAVAVMVSDDGVTADENGRKTVPAGTLLGETLTGAMGPVNSGDTKGVLLSDVDVTYGEAPASMAVHGFIDKEKIPDQPTDDAKAALPMIQFI